MPVANMDFSKDDPDKVFLGNVSGEREDLKKVNNKKVGELCGKHVVEPCTKFFALSDDGWYDLFYFDEQWFEMDPSEILLLTFRDPYYVCKVTIGEDCEKLYKMVTAEAKFH